MGPNCSKNRFFVKLSFAMLAGVLATAMAAAQDIKLGVTYI